MNKAALILVICLCALAGCSDSNESAPRPSATAADTIYFGGPVITMDDLQPTAEAVAVLDGKIYAVGSLEEVSAYRNDQTVEIDLAGRTLSPGFIDGHAHFAQFGAQKVGAILLPAPDGNGDDIDAVVDLLKRFAESDDFNRVGWVYGTGYDDSLLAEGRHPTRDDLDRVSTDHPVMIMHISGHFASVNSKGLELAGIDAETPDPEGGIIRRRPGSQEPNGVLEELAAIPLMIKVLSPKTVEDQQYFTGKGLELAMSNGYTTAQEGRAFVSTHEMLRDYSTAIGFPIDVVSYIDYSDTSPLKSEWHSAEYKNGYRVGGLKVTLDGSPQGRTAWRTQPYLIPPDGQDADYLGYPAFPDEVQLQGIINEGHENNWQILMHANGDAAIDQMLRVIGAAQEQYGSGDRRNTLIHGQYARPDQMQRLAELGMSASLFPMHTFYWGDWHAQIIGEELAQGISPTRTALDLGIPLTSHTDAPVALPNLMQVVWATVNRTSRSGRLIGPDERLTPLEAMKAITIWAATQHFEEDQKGSIEVGKLADLVILSDNPLTIEPENLNQIYVLETIKKGEKVWQRQ